MKLILMRHAIAEERSERYPDDSLRPLSKQGERKHRRVSESLQRIGVSFDELVTSPLVRARQTAEITARAYDWTSSIVETDALGSGFSTQALSEFLQSDDRGESVLCVGHEPDLSAFGGWLLHSSGEVQIAFKKSAVLGMDLPEGAKAGAGELLYFLKPGHLAEMSRGR